MTDMTIMKSDLERRVMQKGKQLLELMQRAEASSKPVNQWLDKLQDRIMEDESFRIQALRFVDVLPSLHTDKEMVSHLKEYFGEDGLPLTGLVRWGIRTAHSGMANALIAKSTRKVMRELARRYMGGATAGEALETAKALRERNISFSLDLLGETTISETEADAYQHCYMDVLKQLPDQISEWVANPVLDGPDGEIPRLNVSLKLTSLYSQFNHLSPQHSIDCICTRLRPILQLARQKGAFVYVDMEQYQYKQTILDCFKQILMEPELRDWADVGIAMQAYLRDTEADLEALADWARQRGTAVSVRLVRGAYWDYETVVAQQQGWPSPIWQQKWQTDACYERCMHLLFANHPHLIAALGTHNVRSIALGMALAEEHGLNASQYEFQMLYGMAPGIETAIPESGHRLRIYVPFGQILPGMAYLVRRLLENSSSQSFQRMRGQRHLSHAQLLASPHADLQEFSTAETQPCEVFRNEPVHRFLDEEERLRFQQALQVARLSFGSLYPEATEEHDAGQPGYLTSTNPAQPSEIIGRVAVAGIEQANQAIQRATISFPEWSNSRVEDRAEVLQKTAALLRQRRDEFAAFEVLEAGKGWQEADANISETIDFLEYYAREALRLAAPQSFDVSGESNHYRYQALGVGLIISPWNFPLAILTGMLSAAIVAGNTVILKPSSQTPVIAARFFALLQEAGLPEGVVELLAGPGDSLGDYLVSHPAIHFIAFTGSRSVGQRILRQVADIKPGQQHIKRVILELGGKNAIIIDSDADLDDAIPGVIESAFGYQGQKCSACSRVIVSGGDRLYQRFLRRLIDATQCLEIGRPDDPHFRIGPVISAGAKKSIEDAISAGKQVATVALEMRLPKGLDGHFIAPVIFRDVAPHLPLAQEEIFGPVLAVMQAQTLSTAIELVNNNAYALTAGIYSRSPANIEQACQSLQSGNLYINRRITGALVNRQPFGGFKLSGTGSKTGGPDYLLQFMTPRTITENTLRRGFAPKVNF